MDRIITKVRETNYGYKMGNTQINILCYADDAAVLIADNENDLQRLIQISRKEAEDVSEFNYLGIIILAHGDLKNIVKNQINKAARIARGLRLIIWKNNYISTESKVRVHTYGIDLCSRDKGWILRQKECIARAK
ncbi:hypothetical protein ACFW04_013177 [Cataglyphis niger]